MTANYTEVHEPSNGLKSIQITVDQDCQLTLLSLKMDKTRERVLTEALGILYEAWDRDLYAGSIRPQGGTRIELPETNAFD